MPLLAASSAVAVAAARNNELLASLGIAQSSLGGIPRGSRPKPRAVPRGVGHPLRRSGRTEVRSRPSACVQAREHAGLVYVHEGGSLLHA